MFQDSVLLVHIQVKKETHDLIVISAEQQTNHTTERCIDGSVTIMKSPAKVLVTIILDFELNI